MNENKTNKAIKVLLEKEIEISNKFHNTISEILRLGYDTDRGRKEVITLIESIEYSLEDIERLINL